MRKYLLAQIYMQVFTCAIYFNFFFPNIEIDLFSNKNHVFPLNNHEKRKMAAGYAGRCGRWRNYL
jgi:hypothetical protein